MRMKCGITGGPRSRPSTAMSQVSPDSHPPGHGHVRCPRAAPYNSRDAAPPPDRARCSAGLHEGRGRVSSGGQAPPHPHRAPCPCQPTGWAGEGTGSRECTGGDPGATDVPAPGEQVSVHIFGMAVYGVEIVGSIRRKFFSTSSS